MDIAVLAKAGVAVAVIDADIIGDRGPGRTALDVDAGCHVMIDAIGDDPCPCRSRQLSMPWSPLL